MADDIDIASELELDFQRRAIEAHRTGAKTLKPFGYCYNCEEQVTGSRIFCDQDCAEDYELRQRRSRGFEQFEGVV